MNLLLLAVLAVPPQAPPVDVRLSALESEVVTLKAKVAALEAKCLQCQCMNDYPFKPFVPKTAEAAHATVHYVQSCANGVCQMVPVQSAQSAPVFGDCSSGQCSGGSCASGNCGGGRRGLFGRRR